MISSKKWNIDDNIDFTIQRAQWFRMWTTSRTKPRSRMQNSNSVDLQQLEYELVHYLREQEI